MITKVTLDNVDYAVERNYFNGSAELLVRAASHPPLRGSLFLIKGTQFKVHGCEKIGVLFPIYSLSLAPVKGTLEGFLSAL